MVKQSLLFSALAIIAFVSLFSVSEALEDYTYYQNVFRKMIAEGCDPDNYEEWLRVYGDLLKELNEAAAAKDQKHEYDVQDKIDYMFVGLQVDSVAETCPEYLEERLRDLYREHGVQFPWPEEDEDPFVRVIV